MAGTLNLDLKPLLVHVVKSLLSDLLIECGSGLRVIKNCSHITFTSLRAIFDDLAKLLF